MLEVFHTEVAMMLQPNDHGFGVPQGSDAAVLGARACISNLPENNAVVKLDFNNSFKLLKRIVVLSTVNTARNDASV